MVCKKHKKIFSFLLFVVVFCIGIFGSVLAFDIPKSDAYVTDQVGILSESEELQLEAFLSRLENETTIEGAVFVVKTTKGEDISMLATKVGHTWWVGKKDVDNGFVFLVAIEDRKWWIAIGYGLEWTITDAITKRIWEANIPDYFRSEKYFEWIYATLEDMEKYILKDSETVAMFVNDGDEQIEKLLDSKFVFFVIILIGVVLAWIARKQKKPLKNILWFWFFFLFEALFIVLVLSLIGGMIAFSAIFFGSMLFLVGYLGAFFWTWKWGGIFYGWGMWWSGGFGWGGFGGFGWGGFGGGGAWGSR